MALVDAKYKLVWINVGYETSDAQLFNLCVLKQRLESKTLGVPLQEGNVQRWWIPPYFFVADETFAMTTWLMKPYARRAMARQERIYNYRLSRARRLVENAFGILTNRQAPSLGHLRNWLGLSAASSPRSSPRVYPAMVTPWPAGPAGAMGPRRLDWLRPRRHPIFALAFGIFLFSSCIFFKCWLRFDSNPWGTPPYISDTQRIGN